MIYHNYRLVKAVDLFKEKGNISKVIDCPEEFIPGIPKEYICNGKLVGVELKQDQVIRYNSTIPSLLDDKGDEHHFHYIIPMKFLGGDFVNIKGPIEDAKRSKYIGKTGRVIRTYPDGREFSYNVEIVDDTKTHGLAFYSFRESELENI